MQQVEYRLRWMATPEADKPGRRKSRRPCNSDWAACAQVRARTNGRRWRIRSPASRDTRGRRQCRSPWRECRWCRLYPSDRAALAALIDETVHQRRVRSRSLGVEVPVADDPVGAGVLDAHGLQVEGVDRRRRIRRSRRAICSSRCKEPSNRSCCCCNRRAGHRPRAGRFRATLR